MANDRAVDIYIPLLMTKGHGYPLWLPDVPFTDPPLPPAYLRCGTQVGDLGYLTDDGGFMYLFNVCRAANDPVNLNRVPPNFVPVAIPNSNIHGRLDMHDRNSVISTFVANSRSFLFNLSIGTPTSPVNLGAGGDLEFTTSSKRAAILVLPDGGERYDSGNSLLLERYAIDNAHSWYRYFNGPEQGRGIRNGMLYLVTGYDKCHSWGNACYSDLTRTRSASLEFKATDAVELAGGVRYNWEGHPDVHKQNHHRNMAPEAVANQTIFLRGYSISVRSPLREKLGMKTVKVFQSDFSKSERPPFGSGVPYAAQESNTVATGTGNTVATGTGNTGTVQDYGAEMQRDTTGRSLAGEVPESSEDESEAGILATDIPYGYITMQADTSVQQLPGRGKTVNPSALINEHILKTYPDATVALTHDDFEWKGMTNNVKNPLNIMELANYAIDNNLIAINESLEIPNAWVARRRDTKIGPWASARVNDKIFALIIGISKYDCPKYPELPGAALDAEKIYKFLRDSLHVPEENIINLRDGQATREAIIQSFRSLEANKEIIRGEVAIIVYYAGYGATAPKPVKWDDWYNLDGQIEILCPADMDDVTGVEGIPDRTISHLLLDLSVKKGNNITLILDCCHSAGINRGSNTTNDSTPIPRQIFGQQKISPERDSDIYSRVSDIRKSDKDIQSGFSGSLWDSHVLLAACSRDELAWEVLSAGVFTGALLRVMKERSLADLTYRSLMDNLSIPPGTKQTPHREGNVVRRLFDPSGGIGDGSMIVCCREVKGGQPYLSLRAGDNLGITRHSVYEICSTDLPGAPSLGTAVVNEVTTEAFSSLSPSDPEFFTNNKDFHVGYARLVKASRPPLLVYGQDLGFLKEVFSNVCHTQFEVPVAIAPDENKADLYLTVEEDNVSFHGGKTNSYYRKDEDSFLLMEGNNPFNLIDPRLTLTTSKKDIAQVRRIINHYARFTYHLTNRSKRDLSDFVDVKMHELVRAPGSLFDLTTTGDNLLVDKKEVQIIVDMSLPHVRRPRYGFTIYNHFGIDLYVYLFYFETSTLKIELWYHSQMSANSSKVPDLVDGCLKKDSSLTLGFGNGGMKPIAFIVPEGQDADICYFKLFVAVKPLDLGSLEQLTKLSLGAGQQNWLLELPPDNRWASLVIPVVQRRKTPKN